MTPFTVEGLLDREDDDDVERSCLAAHLRWLDIQSGSGGLHDPSGALGLVGFARLRARRAPGNTCLDALASTDRAAPFSVERPANRSKGCAGITPGKHVPVSAELGRSGENDDTLGGGWAGHAALGIVVAVTLPVTDFAETTWPAAAHDGDPDSTASLAAQLLGARLVPAQLPRTWPAELELRAFIENAAARLVA